MKVLHTISVRTLDVWPAARLGLCLLALFSVGCRNNSAQRDAYIRELRMQEDQIYELQDYMTEYQELLRRERRKNVKLLKKLDPGEQGSTLQKLPTAEQDDQEERSLLDAAGSEGAGSEGSGRLNQEPGMPAVELGEPSTDESTSGERFRREIEPTLPKIDLGEPAMPTIDLGDPLPMEESTGPVPRSSLEESLPGMEDDAERYGLLEPPLPTETPLPTKTTESIGPGVQQLTAMESGQEIDALQEAIFTPPPTPFQQADSCALYAEQTVAEPAANGGPAGLGMMVIVEPLTERGAAGAFAGELSLMLLDPIADEANQQIARWDFTPEEVEAAWRDVSRRVLDLPIATPADVPLGRPLELWVRLIPNDRDRKILTHTNLELTSPVRLIGLPVSGGANSEASNEQPLTSRTSSGWTVADEFGLLRGAHHQERRAKWQPSTQLPPVAVAQATVLPAANVEPVVQEKPRVKKPRAWAPIR